MRHVTEKQCTSLWIGMLATLLFWVACSDKDDPEEPLPPTDAFDHKDRPIFSCSGELCFDPHDPEVIAQREEALAQIHEMFEKLTMDTPDEDGFDVEEMMRTVEDNYDEMAEEYAACRYSRDADSDFIRVLCPAWVESKSCPGYFFSLDGTPNLITSHPEARYIHYCAPEELGVVAGKCNNEISCNAGLVCSGSLVDTTRSKTLDPEDTRRQCMSPDLCLALAQKFDVNDEKSCFYSDFTRANDTSQPPIPASCDEVPEGMCAQTCDCKAMTDPDDYVLKDGHPCTLLSEQNAVGLCTPKRCRGSFDCIWPGYVCATPRKPPAWVDAFYEVREQMYQEEKSKSWIMIGNFGRPHPGFCVSESVCDAWNDAHNQQIDCGKSP